MAGSDDQIGSAYVVIRATLDQLKKDLAGGEKATKKSATRMQRAFKKAGGAVAGVTKRVAKLAAGMAVGLVAGAAAASKAMIATLDTVDKLSRKLGVSSDFLQEAGFAASQSGIRFETMTMAMQRFTRRAAEAAKGTGEAKDAIKELGIDLLDGAGNLRKSEDLFAEAMEALGQVSNAGERLRLAFKLFDSEGAALVNVAGKFGELTKEARESGLVVESHVIKQAVEANDKLDLLWKKISTELAPSLTDLADYLVLAAEGMLSLASSAGSAWVRLKDFFNLEPTNIPQATKRIAELNEELVYMSDLQKSQSRNFLAGPDRGTGNKYEKFYKAERKNRAGRIKDNRERIAELELLIANQKELSAIPPPLSMDPAHIDQAKDKQKELNEEIEDTTKFIMDEVEELSNVWDGLGEDASKTLAQMVTDGEISFKKLGEAFVREFTQRVLKDLIFQRLINLAGKFLGAAFGDGTSTDTISDISLPPPIFPGGGAPSGFPTGGDGTIATATAAAPVEIPVNLFSKTLLSDIGLPAPVFPSDGVTPEFHGGDNTMATAATPTGAPPITIINNTPANVTAQTSLDGSVEVFIGQSSAKSAASGGALASTLEDRYGIAPTAMRG